MASGATGGTGTAGTGTGGTGAAGGTRPEGDAGSAVPERIPPVRLPVVAVLGCGSMGGAVVHGLLGPGVQAAGIRVTTRTAAHAASLSAPPSATRGEVTALAVEGDPEANRRAARGAGIVVLAVKPHQIGALAAEIREALAPGAIVVSVAAGVPIAAIEARLPDSVAVLRAMPNTPAVIGRGVTGLSAGTRAKPDAVRAVRGLFAQVGDVVEVPEAQLDALSTVSGSGPAYVFYLAEQLTAAAVDLGFTADQAARLVHGTFRGAAELLAGSAAGPAELRRRVTSPHGTTERAVAVLEEARLQDVFDRALAAALARARELAAGA